MGATGKQPISARWVDANTGGDRSPGYRLRLIVREVEKSKVADVFAAMSPPEANMVGREWPSEVGRREEAELRWRKEGVLARATERGRGRPAVRRRCRGGHAWQAERVASRHM